MKINDVEIRAKGMAINPVYMGILEQYIGNGEIIDSHIAVETGEKITTIVITPKAAFGLDRLVKWLEKVHSVLAAINKISSEAHEKIQMSQEPQ